MKQVYLLALLLFLAACGAPENENNAAAVASTGELTVTNVRANLSLPTDTGSVWLDIHNGTNSDDALRGAEIDGCGTVEFHSMAMQGDVMIMGQVEGGQIPVPAGATVRLEQGGLHMMCFNKAAPLEPGSSVAIALYFTNAGTVNVVGEVVAPGETN